MARAKKKYTRARDLQHDPQFTAGLPGRGPGVAGSRRRQARDAQAVRENGREPEPGAPTLWAARPVKVFGQYPKGFVAWAASLLRVGPARILHICSGSLEVGWLRVDIRRDAAPDVVADGQALPLADGCAPAVLIDPPYTPRYARKLYGTRYVRPSALLREAARVVQPGGYIGMLHLTVPNPPGGTQLAGVWGITTGCGYKIRAFTLYVRDQPELPL